MRPMHEVDYKIFGDDMQFVEVELDPGEATVAEAGGMMYMEDGIEMETIFGDGSQQRQDFIGALMGAGKRLLTGESLFMTVFFNKAAQKKHVAFGAPYPGKIVPIHLSQLGGELITQKDSFLAAAKGVSIGIAFQKRLGVGLFGGEGFIMQRLQGDGWVFVHAGGALTERTLAPAKSYASTPGASLHSSPVSATTSSTSARSSLPFSAVKDSSSPRCGGPVAYGCSPCPSAAWPIGLSPRPRAPAAAAVKKARSSAASATFSTATTHENSVSGTGNEIRGRRPISPKICEIRL